jgi:molybdopterin-guanine dinucleotide biosynthesis protein A
MEITGYITAGGKSRRFEEDKSLYPYRGKPLIQHVYEVLRSIFPRVCVIADEGAKYSFLDADIIPDRVKGFGPLGGLYTALAHTAADRIFFCGCDMPNLSRDLIGHMAALSAGYDVVVPAVPKGYEPLHAMYAKRCLHLVEKSIEAGRRRLIAFYSEVKVRKVTVEEMQRFGDWEHMLYNINYKHEAAAKHAMK